MTIEFIKYYLGKLNREESILMSTACTSSANLCIWDQL